MGARIDEQSDGMLIYGVRRLSGTSVSSYGDHRLAAMLAVAGLLAKGETVVRNTTVVGVSYPRFWEDLKELSGAKGA
jgi:3-phosphoshikimate 1-carboxyvinyltransferase